ncbi:hypothetical protein RKE30_10835 [Streptomyces sp. Li-HN-5-11]|uniref:hypothetical protein n=1 Tax=Streptomyces sp. Li-HN-5-11 TaxID=3075432 RepID=UPI0028B0C740|nr:hypothetical protein [Streptomyces sp. Li-HN-5-11]WNM30867.1 hypothetical protein RKE30_10835 [Streptomyces sp. Li-HN-5-11]
MVGRHVGLRYAGVGQAGSGYVVAAAGGECARGAVGDDHTGTTPGRGGCRPAGSRPGTVVASGGGAGVLRARPRLVIAYAADGP